MPKWPLFIRKTFTGMSWSAAVANSWQTMIRLPSPARQTTCSSGHRDLGADRRREPEAHRPEAARVEPPARLGEVVVLRRPHLVLADVGGDDRVALGRLVHRLDHELRLDLGVGRVLVAQRVLLPASSRIRSHQSSSRAESASSARYSPVSFGSTSLASPTIGMWAGTFLEISAGSTSMWTNFARGANSRELAGDPVVEAGADRDDQVGLVHRVVGGPGAVHAEHPEPLLVRRREGAEAHHASGDREACRRRRSSRSSSEALALMTPPPA